LTGGVKPHVLYLIDSLAAGGAERSLVDMAPRLVALGTHLEVAVLVDRPGLQPELTGGGIRVHVIGGTSRGAQYWRLVKFLRARHPDLVHTTLFESDILGRLAAATVRLPVVSTLANTPYGPEHAQEAGVSRLRLRGAQLADMVTAKAVRRFHAVSQATADAYVARLHLDPTHVEVIPRGRDQARLGRRTLERREAVRASLEITPDAEVILAAARQEPQKGLDVLLRALPAVIHTRPQVVLLIAGREGRDSARLQSIVGELGIAASVRFLGERSDVPDLMSAADLFVLPSHREGLPGVVLEAMALEVPIVASDLPTVREAVPSDEYASLVPPGDSSALADSISEALADPGHSTWRATASRKRFEEKFDIDAVSAAVVDFYVRALSR
jgi:glycosyltransferase involved in cell wall biosynthesis